MKQFSSVLILTLAIFTTSFGQQTDYVGLSKQLLEAARYAKPYTEVEVQLKNASLDDLSSALDTDDKRKAFWMNVYNAYVQLILTEAPSKFEDRGKFFAAKQICIAQEDLSFDDIEHGIIRKSAIKLSLGFFSKIFVGKYERKLRVKKRDGRIHFALNCGAKSCPPVAIYDADRLNEQMDASAGKFLKETSRYYPDQNKVDITSLFSWFRGDFGGKNGIKEYLQRYDIIPADADPNINFTAYDWTLSLNNYIDL